MLISENSFSLLHPYIAETINIITSIKIPNKHIDQSIEILFALSK